jgi:hypothetical protein
MIMDNVLIPLSILSILIILIIIMIGITSIKYLDKTGEYEIFKEYGVYKIKKRFLLWWVVLPSETDPELDKIFKTKNEAENYIEDKKNERIFK